MDVEDLKNGICFFKDNGNYNEGVLIKFENDYFLVDFHEFLDVYCITAHPSAINTNTFLNNICNQNKPVPVPHFCFLKNAYSVLSKYGKKFQLIGHAKIFGKEKEERISDALYLQTEKETFLEIVIGYAFKYRKYYPVLWINEEETVRNLHFVGAKGYDEICKYYFWSEMPIFLENVNGSYIGFMFNSNKGDYQISITNNSIGYCILHVTNEYIPITKERFEEIVKKKF